MTDALSRAIDASGRTARVDVELAPLAHPRVAEGPRNRTEWLIDNSQVYGPLLESLRGARRTVHIAQLAFDADCAAYTSDSPECEPSRDAVIAEALIDLAASDGPRVRILLNASWLLDTARPLRKFFARRGAHAKRIQVRGMRRFPHFMHAKLVLIDGHEAFLLGSPFVNSYWDDDAHAPFDPRRPLRELGGRPLHDVSMRLRGPVVGDLEAMFAELWRSCDDRRAGTLRLIGAREAAKAKPAALAGTRMVCDAPEGVLPGTPDRARHMLGEMLAGIARARDYIYIEHQYLTSRPIVAALATALRLVPALEIIIVLNQNPDLTAYRVWQNAQLTQRALLTHPRVGVFSLWSSDAHPQRAGVTRISQLFIHSKVVIVDDVWAAVGSSNLDGVSMSAYGDDFASALGRRVFRDVRNVEVNVIIDAQEAHDASHGRKTPELREEEAHTIAELRERLWQEHLGASRAVLRKRPERGWLATWRAAAARNVDALLRAGAAGQRHVPAHPEPSVSSLADRPRMAGRVLPYRVCAFPNEQLADLGIVTHPDSLELCYNPTWFSVHASAHWIRNIF